LPKKTWLYNSLGLLVDKDDLVNTDTFQTYGNLSMSHRIQLLPIDDLEQKKELIVEIEEKNYSVRDLHKRVKEIRPTINRKERRKVINPSKQLEKLKSCVDGGRVIIQLLIASESKNPDYKDLKEQLDMLMNSVDEMIQIQEKRRDS
jgi:succinate dehydrogenase/fumarate reductase-like Fe-S protein